MATTSSVPFSVTSLPGHTGATTPSGFSGSMGPSASVAAVLVAGQTTLTAYEVMTTTGIAVVDGTTLTWRGQGITLGNGDVVSLGENGLEDSTTTAFYEAVTVGSGSGSSTASTTGPTVVVTRSSTTLTSTRGNTNTQTGGGSPTQESSIGTGTASAASTSSSGIAPSMSAGKALALLGAVGGMVVLGL